MRPSNESLLTDYIRDLEVEIECNARERASGRTDLDEYDAKCRAELAKLKGAASVSFDQYGQPKVHSDADMEQGRLTNALLRST